MTSIFLGGIETDLSLLNIVLSDRGSQFSSAQFDKAYSDYSLPPSLPHHSNVLTQRCEKISHIPNANKQSAIFPPQSSDSCVPLHPTEDEFTRIGLLKMISNNSNLFQ